MFHIHVSLCSYYNEMLRLLQQNAAVRKLESLLDQLGREGKRQTTILPPSDQALNISKNCEQEAYELANLSVV